jgi:ubiquinone/menaquinone biosynthesis C-methylase UbiE
MPSMEVNRYFWDTAYTWSDGGDEWSTIWGGAQNQWNGTMLPRIRRHLPVHTILEIAPGFGRWTQFLAGLCERLIVVDLSEKCIAACRERFRDATHIEYHVNDGRSLGFVADRSVDFVFSFDSLVHVEADVVESYVGEIGRILKDDGTGFIHHSNCAEYRILSGIHAFLDKYPRLQTFIREHGLVPSSHGRAPSMSAAKFRDYAEKAGIRCTSQERVNWGSKRTIDCLSTIENGRVARHGPVATLHNPHFMHEAKYLAQLARLYDRTDADGG